MATKRNLQPSAVNTGPAKPKGKPRNQKNLIPVKGGTIAVYASPRISRALDEISEDMPLYHGVRLAQILEAIYTQGRKDGARAVFENLESKMKEVQKAIPHKNPGKPRKSN